MRYDPEDIKYYFSTEMIPGEADTQASLEHFKAYQHESMAHLGTWAKNEIKDADGNTSTAKTAAGIVISIAFILCIVAALLCIPVNRYDLIPWFIGADMFIVGIGMVITPAAKKANGFAESVLCQRIEGIISLLGAIGLILVSLLYPRENIVLFAIALFCEIALVVFLSMLVKTIGVLRAPKTVYSREVQATCIGYVRTYTAHTSDGGPADEIPLHSPVFEYYFEGVKYQSYYDLLLDGKDGNIPVGSTVKIKVNPDSPSLIYGDYQNRLFTPLVITIVAFAAFVVFAVLLKIYV